MNKKSKTKKKVHDDLWFTHKSKWYLPAPWQAVIIIGYAIAGLALVALGYFLNKQH